MILVVRRTIWLLSAVAVLFLGGGGCSDKPSSKDQWEAVRLAKNRTDLIPALQQISAELYALKLIADCKSDQTKCIEATKVLEFAFVLTEGENSDIARLMCTANQAFTLHYLYGIDFNLQLKLAENLPEAEAAPIRASRENIQTLQDRYKNQCSHYK